MPDTHNIDWVLRLRLRHQLLEGSSADSPEAVVASMTAMQAQDHAAARWSVAQRARTPLAASAIDSAFDEGRVLRTHVLRPTWHFVVPGDLRWLIRLTGPRVEAANARHYRELELDPPTLLRSEVVIAEAVSKGPQTRNELAAALEAKRIRLFGERLTYVLMHAELCAHICSGPKRGRQHTYAAFDTRVPPSRELDAEEALLRLARRYFSSRGPASVKDFAWWSGLGSKDAVRALELVREDLVSVDPEGTSLWFFEGNVPSRRRPRVDLVACYDEIVMSYSVTRSLMACPGVDFPVPGYVDGFRHVMLIDGRILGHWRTESTSSSGLEMRPVRLLRETERYALSRSEDRYRRFAGPSK